MSGTLQTLHEALRGLWLIHAHTPTMASEAGESIHEVPYLMKNRGNLFTAAMENDVERLREIIASGTDVSKPNEYGFTALHYTARK